MIGLILVVVIAYRAGSIPFSYIAGKAFAGIDLREHGSGNLGATNSFRLLGAKIAIGVLIADVAKGFLPVYFAPQIGAASGVDPHWLMMIAAFSAVIGHMYSIYMKFHGGKGIATTAGAFLALAPWVLAATFSIWLLTLLIRRIVSLASLFAAVALPIVVFVFDRTGIERAHWSLMALSVAIMLVLLIRHQSNIKRLLAGQEATLQRHKQ